MSIPSPLLTDNDAIMSTDSSSSFSSIERNGTDDTAPTLSSCELKARVPCFKVLAKPKPRSAEKIMNSFRRMEWLDNNKDVKTDASFKINRFTANKLCKSSLCLQWKCVGTDNLIPSHYEGQASLLRGHNGEVMLLTAQRNICSEYNIEGEWEMCLEGHPVFLADGVREAQVVIPNTGWCKGENFPSHPLRDDAGWSSGKDISLGPDIRDVPELTRAILEMVSVNDIIESDFVCTVGMRVGKARPHAV